ncbi:hypothetical protein EYF80_023873 [Liparis tanakae]|uniref:Uncharacterized protein n=1 Tax=Liparis tanakae TaxID=230148 RepID=A0A4Z2HLK4_9TELE|nr:hypothetical protein EYF80_023873 [Liparis tanakae]
MIQSEVVVVGWTPIVKTPRADEITVEGGEALRSSAAAARCPEQAAGASTSPGHLLEEESSPTLTC